MGARVRFDFAIFLLNSWVVLFVFLVKSKFLFFQLVLENHATMRLNGRKKQSAQKWLYFVSLPSFLYQNAQGEKKKKKCRGEN